MNKKKVISFEKEECDVFLTVGDLADHLKNFDRSLPLIMPHEAGPTPITGGVLARYNSDNEDLQQYNDIEDEEVLEDADYIDVLFLY